MSRIQADAVAPAVDGVPCVVYQDDAGQHIVEPRSPTAFDPRTRLTPRQVRMFKASNAFWRHGAALFHFWQIAGGAFSEVGTTRHYGGKA